MADVNFSIGMVGITGTLLINARPVATPTVIEQSQSYPGPQPSIRNLIWTGLSPEITYFDFRETSGAGLGVLLSTFTFDVKNNRPILERRFYHVDGGGAYDPLDGSTNITDPYLDGKTITGVFQEGYRYLDAEKSEWRQDAGGVLTFLNDMNSGTQITSTSNQVWAVEITYPINVPGTGPTAAFSDVVFVTADITLSSAQYNKTVSVAGSGTTQVTNLPGIGTVPNVTGYKVKHDGGSAINVKVKAATGEVFMFRGTEVNYILLAKGEFIRFLKASNNKWYVDDWQGQWARIGEQVSADIVIDNSLTMDGAQYDGAVYIRAYEFILNNVPLDQKTSITAWLLDDDLKGFYAIDTVGKLFKTPMRTGYSTMFLSNIGTTDPLRPRNVPGGKQPGQVGEVNTTFKIKQADTSTSDTGIGKIVTGSAGNEPRDSDTLALVFNVGKENAVKNIGQLPLFLI